MIPQNHHKVILTYCPDAPSSQAGDSSTVDLEGCEPTESYLAGLLSSSKVVVSSATLMELNVYSILLAAVIQAKEPHKGH